MRSVLIIVVCLALSPIAFAADIYVPDDYSKIQDAINAAVDGDTVIVRPGTYVENIDFVGKAITLRSEMGASQTVIDGNSAGSVVTIAQNEGRDSVLEGFTITNGTGTSSTYGSSGGGIYLRASPTIRDSVITNNSVWGLGSGAGIKAGSDDPLIEGNIISQNTGDGGGEDGEGGGIYLHRAGTVRNNIIDDNSTNTDGGGVYCSGTAIVEYNVITNNRAGRSYKYEGYGGGIFSDDAVIVRGNVFSGNDGDRGGGALCCWGGSPTIEDNVIIDNFTVFPWGGGAGGGIYCFDVDGGTITRNVIARNDADEAVGGGLYLSRADNFVVSDNVFAYNTSGNKGGGVSFGSGSPLFVNNTVFGNSAVEGGGGLAANSGADIVEVTNTILWQNQAPSGSEIYLYYSGGMSVSYCDVQGGQAAAYVESGTTLNWGSGNIDADPLFLDPANNDFHIPYDSPCRSAGDRNAPGLPDTDFEGDPRTGLFAFPDIGADEFHTHFYVNGTVSQGSNATAVIIGWPKTNPVMLISGSGVLPTPDPTPYGDFWLMPPWEHRVHFNAMPDNGVRIIDRVVSTGLPPGTQIPFQALVGTELSNLWVVDIE